MPFYLCFSVRVESEVMGGKEQGPQLDKVIEIPINIMQYNPSVPSFLHFQYTALALGVDLVIIPDEEGSSEAEDLN